MTRQEFMAALNGGKFQWTQTCLTTNITERRTQVSPRRLVNGARLSTIEPDFCFGDDGLYAIDAGILVAVVKTGDTLLCHRFVPTGKEGTDA